MNGEMIFVDRINKVEEGVVKAEKVICCAMLILMTVATTIQVILRNIFNMSLLVGIDELINWTFVWMVFIGMGMMISTGGHVGLEFIRNKLPVTLHKIGTVIIDLVMMFMAAVIIKNGIPFVQSQMDILTTSANIPKAFLFLAIPIGMTLMFFHLLVKIINICSGRWVVPGTATGKDAD